VPAKVNALIEHLQAAFAREDWPVALTRSGEEPLQRTGARAGRQR